MESAEALYPKLTGKTRTAGDGMESAETAMENQKKLLNTEKRKLSKGKSLSQSQLVPGRLIQMIPTKAVGPLKKKQQIYSKGPKFVPYEPYPGAVKPIIPLGKLKDSKRISKNNMDLNTLIAQMSQMDTRISEFKPRVKHVPLTDKQVPERQEWNEEKTGLLSKIDTLSVENDTLKDQLKQQAQVNKELKTMLVASMGEDLETQVQSLNEDKRHLANALLSSAQHLSTHQEQTEWLAGQCEVWRSKFLASSLMVEELANWKRVLNQRTEDLQQSIKEVLEERCRTRDMLLCTYKNLYSLHEKWLENMAMTEFTDTKKGFMRPIGNLNLTASIPPTSNILDLASVNLKLSDNISNCVEKCDVNYLQNLSTATEGEKKAEHLVANSLVVQRVSEVPVNALVNHAYNTSGTTSKPIAACVHCNGQVQLL